MEVLESVLLAKVNTCLNTGNAAIRGSEAGSPSGNSAPR
jgi:hypothetical protein